MVYMILKDALVYWRCLLILLAPLLLSPFLFVWSNDKAAHCAYVILLIATYWVFDVLPLPVTALLPIVLFPLLGVLAAKKVASLYLADASFVMLAGLMMAVAIERSNLHKRFGMWVLLLFGFTPSRMLLGFIVPSWFLSMWISNTATASMMVPIVEAVLLQYRRGLTKARKKKEQVNDAFDNLYEDFRKITMDESQTPKTINTIETKPTDQSANGKVHHSNGATPLSNQSQLSIEEGGGELDEEMEKKLSNISKMLLLGVAYAAGLGGNGTLTGATSNLIVVEEAAKSFERHGHTSPLNYTTWLLLGFPFSICGVVVLALWLKLYFLGWRSFKISCGGDDDDDDGLSKQQEKIKEVVKEEYKKLGTISFSEISSLIFLVLMVMLWFARDPGFMPGYASLFEEGYVSDSVPAIFIVILLFIFPSSPPQWICLRKNKEAPPQRVGALLDWRGVSSRLPWGTVLLLGGGFAMAEACKVSGLSAVLGDLLSLLQHLPTWVLVLVTMVMVALTTEVLCGCATLALFLPIIDAMATDFGLNPLLLMLPAGLAASCAFMLPTGSIQNSIIFSYGNLKVVDMLGAGVVMNILCLPLVGLAVSTLGTALFDLQTLPWANETLTAF